MILVNFYKFRAISRIVEEVRVYQRTAYTTEHLPSSTPDNISFARWYIENVTSLSEDELWERSLELEPPGRSEKLDKQSSTEGAFMNSLRWRSVQNTGINLTTVVESSRSRFVPLSFHSKGTQNVCIYFIYLYISKTKPKSPTRPSQSHQSVACN